MNEEGELRANQCLGICRIFGELSKAHSKDVQHRAKRTRGATQTSAPGEEETYPLAHGRVHMIQEGRPSKNKEEASTLQTYMATELKIEAPYYLCDSEVDITFSQ